MTILCSIAFAACGIALGLGSSNSQKAFHGQTISAATLPYKLPDIPLDLQLDLEKKCKSTDTVYVDGAKDTVFVERIVKPKRHKAVGWAEAKRNREVFTPIEPDSLLRESPPEAVREEQPADIIGTPKVSIILTVDGKEVYKR